MDQKRGHYKKKRERRIQGRRLMRWPTGISLKEQPSSEEETRMSGMACINEDLRRTNWRWHGPRSNGGVVQGEGPQMRRLCHKTGRLLRIRVDFRKVHRGKQNKLSLPYHRRSHHIQPTNQRN